jgi:hypothetical protein
MRQNWHETGDLLHKALLFHKENAKLPWMFYLAIITDVNYTFDTFFLQMVVFARSRRTFKSDNKIVTKEERKS